MRDRQARTRDAQRGMVVVVALLVMLALAGIALVGAQRVSEEIDRTGNFRVAKDGAALTQSASAAAVALVEANGASILNAMQIQGKTDVDLDENSFAELDLFDLAEGGSFSTAIADEDASFRNRLSIIGQATAPGYSVGEFLFYRVALTTWGNFGDPTATGMEQLQTAQQQIRAIMLVGPLAQAQPVQ